LILLLPEPQFSWLVVNTTRFRHFKGLLLTFNCFRSSDFSNPAASQQRFTARYPAVARRIAESDETLLSEKNSYPIIEIIGVFNFQEANCLAAT
jgi:hypothetical protein